MAFSNAFSFSFFLLVLPFFLINTEAGALRRRALGSADTIAQFLNSQNAVRRQFGLPPLRWSNKLMRNARWYAYQRGECALLHSAGNYGESLFWGRGTGWKIADAIAAWAAEKQYYSYRRNACVGERDCLHFTQLVWRRTQRVGCARTRCGSGDTYIVCEYDPHGNVIGQRPY